MKSTTNLLPNLNQLEEFLSSITRFDPNDGQYKSIIVSTEKVSQLPNGHKFSTKRQYIWFKEYNEFTLDSVHKILKRALLKLEHPTSEGVFNHILLLLTYLPNRNKGNIALLEDVFSKLQTITSSQYIFLPILFANENESIHFGNFRIGKIDEEKFAYWCKKATTDFYELYKEDLRNKLVIEREHFQTNLIIWQNMFDRYFVKSNSFDEHLLGYYENVSAILFDEFWGFFVEDQLLQVSMGIGYIDEKMFNSLFSYNNVTIYTNIFAFGQNVGYLVPQIRGISGINFQSKLGENIRDLNNTLNNKYNFTKFNESEIHKTLMTYIKFNSKGHIHLHENKVNEGFLHFVISLDLLFGDKMASTKSVANRAAILTFKYFDNTFMAQKKVLENIYDARSKYVHKGVDIDIDLLDALKKICRVILETLFQIQTLKKYQEGESFSNWVKELDFYVSGIEIGKSWTDEEFSHIGIEKIIP